VAATEEGAKAEGEDSKVGEGKEVDQKQSFVDQVS
jgi:hypothetical protein